MIDDAVLDAYVRSAIYDLNANKRNPRPAHLYKNDNNIARTPDFVLLDRAFLDAFNYNQNAECITFYIPQELLNVNAWARARRLTCKQNGLQLTVSTD